MNRARIADLLRQLAAEIDGAEVPVAEESKPRRSRRPRTLVRPSGEASSPASPSLARRILNERGFR
jgi:hypothetical protein